MKKVTIYTDGACKGNPGAGGYGTILVYNGYEKELSGGFIETTNNRMELTAAIVGLEALKEPCEVTLYSDSAYVVNPIVQGWLVSWQLKGYKTADNKPVKNVELWQKLVTLLNVHKVNFVKVKGHADNEKNNRCDKLARAQVHKFMDVPF